MRTLSVVLFLALAACGPEDADGDGISVDEDCDDTDATVSCDDDGSRSPNSSEQCDDIDRDCDGAPDGYVATTGDCDDDILNGVLATDVVWCPLDITLDAHQCEDGVLTAYMSYMPDWCV